VDARYYRSYSDVGSCVERRRIRINLSQKNGGS
jgi:hypothetical protein